MSQEERRSGGGLGGPSPDPDRRNEVSRPVGGTGTMRGAAIFLAIVALAVVAFLIYEALN